MQSLLLQPLSIPDRAESDDINQPFSMISDSSTASDDDFDSNTNRLSDHKLNTISISIITDNEAFNIDSEQDDKFNIKPTDNLLYNVVNVNLTSRDSMKNIPNIDSELSLNTDFTIIFSPQQQYVQCKNLTKIGCNPDILGIDRSDNYLYREDTELDEDENWWISAEYFLCTNTNKDIEYEYDSSFVEYGVIV